MPVATVKNGEIYYEESGSGELIVLMAGLGHGAAYFEKTVPLLSGLGRVVAIDPRGVGRSTSKTESYSVESWAEDAAQLMDHLGAPRAHLVGSSLGACVALQAAVDFPDRVSSLVAVAGFSELDRSLELNFRMRIGIIEQLGLGDVLAAHIAMWTLGRDYINTDEGRVAVERLFASVRLNSPKRYLAFIRAILAFGRLEPDQQGQPKLTERLGEIRAPTCVIVGETGHPHAGVPVRAAGKAHRRGRDACRSRLRPHHVYRAPGRDVVAHQGFPGQGHSEAGRALDCTARYGHHSDRKLPRGVLRAVLRGFHAGRI